MPDAAAEPDVRQPFSVRRLPEQGRQQRFSIGRSSLTGKPHNAFNTLTFPVPSGRSQIGNSCDDFRPARQVNVPVNATGTYLLDNVRGIAVVQATPLPTREFEVPLIVQIAFVPHRRRDLLPAGAGPAAGRRSAPTPTSTRTGC